MGKKKDRDNLTNTAKELKQARLYTDNLIRTANVMIVGLDTSGKIQVFNPVAERITGYKREEVDGRNWFDVLVPTEKYPEVREEFQRLLKGGMPKEFENPILTKDGKERVISWSNNEISIDGKMAGTISFGIDITERRSAEKKLRDSLQEKELLLKEIHHRVKNNMAVIAGLLNLQSSTFQDPKVRNVFKNTQQRIRSMALVHERLYKARDLAKIDFNLYLPELTKQILQTNSIHHDQIKLIIDTDEISLGVDRAIPLSLIINELTSNAVKHAFPDRKQGTVEICLKETEEQIVLTVSDNGIGLKESIGTGNISSFGLYLVDLLCQQLNGTVDIRRENGTSVRIAFPR